MSSGSRRSLAALLLVLSPPAALAAGAPHRSWKKQWIVSTLAVAAASFADASTSLGHYEQNPLLRGPGGQFSAPRAFALKSGTTGALVLVEALLARKHSHLYQGAAITNFAMTGVFAAVAARNATQPTLPRAPSGFSPASATH